MTDHHLIVSPHLRDAKATAVVSWGFVLGLALAACGDGDDGNVSDAGPDAPTDLAAVVDGGGGDGAGGAPDGGGGDAGLSPGVRGSRWDGLGEGDRRQVCDWIVGQFGGYGRERICPDGSTLGSLFESQTECLTTMAACDAQVSALETCFSAQARDLCAEDLPAECQDLPETCI